MLSATKANLLLEEIHTLGAPVGKKGYLSSLAVFNGNKTQILPSIFCKILQHLRLSTELFLGRRNPFVESLHLLKVCSFDIASSKILDAAFVEQARLDSDKMFRHNFW